MLLVQHLVHALSLFVQPLKVKFDLGEVHFFTNADLQAKFGLISTWVWSAPVMIWPNPNWKLGQYLWQNELPLSQVSLSEVLQIHKMYVQGIVPIKPVLIFFQVLQHFWTTFNFALYSWINKCNYFLWKLLHIVI